MTAKIIDGNAIAKEVRAQWKKRAELLKDKGVVPGLAVIIVGDNHASQVYVRNKVKACA
ncbi:MAG: tetrahydrofolate dehydrogenase/cyclohydrolase catalytic domain-containing protein, partial [Burkholderiales bacterium]